MTVIHPIHSTRASALRYLSCLRPQDILVLQGSPLLGAAFAIGRPTVHDLGPLATLIAANILLVTHIFMLNDWSGLTSDFADPNKAARVFTARGVRRRDIGVLMAGCLVVSLLLFSCVSLFAFGLAVAITSLSALYSLPRFNWKGRPILNSLAHLTGGILHFLLGYSIRHAIDGRGLATATFFGLIFTAGHLTQEVRDHQGDTINAIRTNAVVFGQRRAFAASLMLFTLAQILLLLLSLQGILPRPLAALVALFPLQLHWSLRTLREGLTYASVCRLQTRYRVLYAVIGLAIVAALCTAPIAATDVSERISNYEKHGLCHGLRILRSFRSLTPIRPALRMTGDWTPSSRKLPLATAKRNAGVPPAGPVASRHRRVEVAGIGQVTTSRVHASAIA